MRPEYDGVKFYSKNDWSISDQLKEAEPIIESFNTDRSIEDINEILELFNIQELLETEVILSEWNEDFCKKCIDFKKSITSYLGKFFAKIDDANFTEYTQKVTIGYIDDFLELAVRFKLYNRISPSVFYTYLQKPDTSLGKILKHKEFARAYDEQIANILRVSDQTYRILSTQFLEKSAVKFFLPASLLPAEYEGIFQEYVNFGKVHPNVLQLIYKAQSTAECPISDKLRLSAKRRYDDFWKKPGNNVSSIGCGFGLSFAYQDELKKYEKEGSNFHISYDIKWLEENLDYPTIMNNFIYIFEMFDLSGRSTLVSVKSKIGAIENALAVKGIRFYQRGNQFNFSAMISNAKMALYYEFLESHDIDLEDVFVWFFTEYLPSEFEINGFSLKASSATSFVEKCRNLSSEMDGVLKQFRMYVRDGRIDRELFEMSSEHLVVDGLPSLILNKYAYPNGKNIQDEMFALFSDQSLLSYIPKLKLEYSTLFDLLLHETIHISCFEKYQVTSINWLIERHCLFQADDGTIRLNKPKVAILKELYNNDVACVHHLGGLADVLSQMRSAGDIRVESTLFSEPEKDYLNYELNKSEFSDGLDLRNKYSHSTYPQDEEVQKRDYYELLKIMVLIITKINEEFRIRAEKKIVEI